MALLLLCLNITAFAQITLNMSNITVKAAMEQLKKDYGYSFVFESGDVNTQKVISVNLKNKSVAETVSQILQGQEVNYEISGRNILVRKKAITPANYEQPQKKSISGKVLDENGEPVSGATVVEKNTTNGTATDIDGNFTLNNVPSNAALQISYIGYKTLEISDLTTGGKPLIITLSEESQALDEVVVIGYGVIKKIDLSGSVASVGGDRLAAVQATSVSQALQGAMPGVQVTRSSSCRAQALLFAYVVSLLSEHPTR